LYHFYCKFNKKRALMEIEYHYCFKNKFRPLGSLSLHEVSSFSCPASYTLHIEQSDSYAIYLIDKGKGIYILGSTEFQIEECDIFVAYPDAPVRCVSDKDEPLKIFALSFGGEDAQLLLSVAGLDLINPVRTLDSNTAKQLLKIINDIYALQGQEIQSFVQSTSLIYTMLSALAKTANWKQSKMLPSASVAHFQKALDFIANNYSKSIKVTDISDRLCLSRSRLYRLFIQHISIPPQQYLTEYRVRQAIYLLKKRKSSIREIANAVGIKNPLYFSKLFKQVTGKSPKNYMKEINKHLLN
jgi:AraC-like DNA-binding protein